MLFNGIVNRCSLGHMAICSRNDLMVNANIHTVDANRSGGRFMEARQKIHERGLPAPLDPTGL